MLDDDDESDEDNDDTEKNEENSKPPVIMADCSSQYEDLVRQEADILTWKKKLRVKRRKLVSTQPLMAYPGTGIGRSLQYSMNLPDDNTFDASFRQRSVLLKLMFYFCFNLFKLNLCLFGLEASNLNHISSPFLVIHLTAHLRDMSHL